MTPHVRWVANLSMLFTELPLLDRPAAARAEGFDEIEMWWPFDGRATPSPAEVDRLVESVLSSGTTLTAMNLYAGTMSRGDRGVLSHPAHVEEFHASLDTALAIARRLGTRLFNAPYGLRLAGLPESQQRQTALQNLAHAAARLREVGGTVLVEPLSSPPDYPLRSATDATELIDAVRTLTGHPDVGLLLDQFHLDSNGHDPVPDTPTLGYVRHVQVAEPPHRGEPGSGAGRVPSFVADLVASGYRGAVALEYQPTTTTVESLRTWRRHLMR